MTSAGLAIATAVTGMLSGILWWFFRLYHREHFLWWSRATAAASASYAAAGAMVFVAGTPWGGRAIVELLAASVQGAVALAVVALVVGTLVFTGVTLTPRRRYVAMVAAVVVAAGLAIVTHRVFGDVRGAFVSLAVRSVMTTGALGWSAVRIWRHEHGVPVSSARMLVGAIVALTVVQAHNIVYGAMRAAGWEPPYPFLLLVLTTGLLLGVLAVVFATMALGEERRRGELAAEQAKAATATLDRREAWFQRLIEHSNDVITVLDEDAIIRFESPSITRVVGYEPEECLGKAAFDYLHPDDVASTVEALRRGIQTKQPVAHQFRFRHKKGHWVWVESVGKLVEDGERAPLMIINSRDISDRQHLEHQLIEAQKMESVGRLAGGVAHDFNNLLTIIGGNTDLVLAALPPGSPFVGELDEIRTAADRATQLTRQLLTLARRGTAAPRVIDVNDQVAQIERLLRRVIGATISLEVAPLPGGGSVRVDPIQLEQVLLNLAVNARDAMPHGGRLSIRVTRRAANAALGASGPGWIALEVADTGLGMDESVRRHLFEPFFTTKPPGAGTGLGLATSYGIIRDSGGSIEVATVRGRGSCFTVLLPEVGASQPAPTTVSPIPIRSGNELVLVVEDDPAVRRVAVTVLRSLGYRVIEAADGEQAITRAKDPTEPVQLVVTDVVMPRLGGVGLAERLRSAQPDLPVVFTSGYSEEFRPVEMPRRSSFLPKPYTPDDLADQVRKLLDVGAAA